MPECAVRDAGCGGMRVGIRGPWSVFAPRTTHHASRIPRSASRLSCPMRKALVFVFFLLLPTPAFADLTLFLGINGTPSKRQVRGFSGGIGLVIVAFEFEYASTSEDLEELAPSLKTYMFNGLLQTPFAIGGFQPYGTVGGGVYRERLGEGTAAVQETHVGMNIGGGVKINLAGPLRVRVDYRVFTLRGSPLHGNPKRFYAGLNLKF
jgi:opacity protein-like surface antigen